MPSANVFGVARLPFFYSPGASVYLSYLDESGNPEDWTQNRHFVLAGAAVFEGEISGLTEALDGIQKAFVPGVSDPIELHAHHISKGKGRWRQESEELRKDLLRSVYETIAHRRFPGVVLFGAAVHESSPQPGGKDGLHIAFEEVCGRFNQFLVRMARGPRPEKGLLIVDDSGRQKRYRQLSDSFRREGVRLGYLGNVVDIPYFTHAQHTRLIQVADFVAYAVYEYYEHQDSTFLDVILERFDWPERATRGRPVGLCHVTRASTRCDCPATHARP